MNSAHCPVRTEFDELESHQLFQNFLHDDYVALTPHVRPVHLKVGQYLFFEGACSDTVYILVEGELAVEKQGHRLNTVSRGSYIGEISLLDGKPRSASVLATRSCKLWAIDVEGLAADAPNVYAKLILCWARPFPEYVRRSSDGIVQSMTNELALVKRQNVTGQFVSYVTAILALSSVMTRALIDYEGQVNDATYIRITVVLTLVVGILAIKSERAVASLGLTLVGSKKSLWEASLFTLLFFLISASAISVVNYLYPELVRAFSPSGEKSASLLFRLVLSYCVCVPLQEFIVRGCLQSALSQFFTDRYTALRAIVLSNLIFCSFYALLSLRYALMLFVLGLGLGWLYNRSPTLSGVVLSHIAICIWITPFLGLSLY